MMFVCVLPLAGSSGAAAGSEGRYGAAGEEQNSTLHPLHAALYRKLPQLFQCESQTSQVHVIALGHNDKLLLFWVIVEIVSGFNGVWIFLSL